MTLLRSLPVAVAALIPPAAAQNAQAPAVITVPGLDRFSLPPSNTQAPAPTPSPTPTPTPTTVPAPPPPVATPRARVRATSVETRPQPTPTPSASPSAPEPTPAPTPSPATPTPTPSPAAPVAEPSGWPRWLPFAALALLVGGFAIIWLRRRRSAAESELVIEDDVVVPPEPPPPLPAPPAQPLAIEIIPTALAVADDGATLDFELVVANTSSETADGIRPMMGLITAAPDLERRIAAFHAAAPLSAPGEPFALAPGEARRLAGQLALPREAMHVAAAGGRPMIVPVVLVNLRWRGGLSIRTLAEARMIGTGNAGAARVGPIRLDRGARRYDRLAARRLDAPV